LEERILAILTFLYKGKLTFVNASLRRAKNPLIWYPIAVTRFGNCKKCGKDYYMVDCYTSTKIKSPLPRFLILRRIGRRIDLLPSPPVEAPILSHEKCNVIEFMSDAKKLNEILSNRKKALEMLKKESPEKYWQPIVPKSILYLPFLPGRANVPEAIYSVNISLLKEILRNLCLDNEVAPTEWIPSHILMEVFIKRSYALLYEGRKSWNIRALDAYLFKEGIVNEILERLGIRSQQ